MLEVLKMWGVYVKKLLDSKIRLAKTQAKINIKHSFILNDLIKDTGYRQLAAEYHMLPNKELAEICDFVIKCFRYGIQC